MNAIENAIHLLTQQRAKIDTAIAALRGVGASGVNGAASITMPVGASKPTRRKHHIASPELRDRVRRYFTLPKGKRPLIVDIAEETGLSLSTIARIRREKKK